MSQQDQDVLAGVRAAAAGGQDVKGDGLLDVPPLIIAGEKDKVGDKECSRVSTPKSRQDEAAVDAEWDKIKTNQACSMFVDKEAIKMKVRSTLDQGSQAYDVAMYYHETGWARTLATDWRFENTTLAVISINAMYMALDTDWNKASTGKVQAGFVVMEQLFCIYFTYEWIVRFCAFKNKLDGRKDAWFVFDSILVFMMVFETWFLAILAAISGGGGELPFPAHLLRIFRLLRLSRLMRMLRSLPELMILIKGMVAATSAVFWVTCLQVLITYVFAILFTQLCGNVEGLEPFFKNIPLSMWSLFIYATCLDNLADFMNAIRISDAGWYGVPFAMLFIAVATLTIMNMLIGVLCDVVSAVAQSEREETRFLDVRDRMSVVMNELDSNKDNLISYDEFKSIINRNDVKRLLKQVDVDPDGFMDFGELYFFDDEVEKKLQFDDFMDMIMDLRENNQATVKSLLNMWLKVKTKLKMNTDEVNELCAASESTRTEFDEKFMRIQSQVHDVLGGLQKLKP